MKVALIACTKSKAPSRCAAKDLYWPSALFRLSWQYAQQQGYRRVIILSAKHGPIKSSKVIEPYNSTLKAARSGVVRDWGDFALPKLRKLTDLHKDEFLVLAGEPYRRHLVPYLSKWVCPMVHNPELSQDARMGFQLRWYQRQLDSKPTLLGRSSDSK